MHLNIINVTIKKYAFRKHHFFTILIIFVLIKQSYELCLNTKYILNFINLKFLFEVFLKHRYLKNININDYKRY